MGKPANEQSKDKQQSEKFRHGGKCPEDMQKGGLYKEKKHGGLHKGKK